MLPLSATSTFLSTVIFFHYVLVPVFSKTEKKVCQLQKVDTDFF